MKLVVLTNLSIGIIDIMGPAAFVSTALSALLLGAARLWGIASYRWPGILVWGIFWAVEAERRAMGKKCGKPHWY